jgi:hypothetical protein
MRLGVNVSKGIHLDPQDRKALINESYIIVTRIIDKFDWTRKVRCKTKKGKCLCRGICLCQKGKDVGKLHPIKFSTYAGWAIQKSLWTFCRKECRKKYLCGGTADDLGLDEKELPDQGYTATNSRT